MVIFMANLAITALVFDAGDILVHSKGDIELESWREISGYFKIWGIPLEDYTKYFLQFNTRLREFGLKQNSKKIVISLQSSNRKDLCLPVKLLEQYEAEKWWMNPAPGLKQFIEELKTFKFKIGILTDSVLPVVKIREVLHDISPMVDSVVSSREFGKQKPDIGIYNHILSRLKVTNSSLALFIGHDYEELEGAKRVGMRILSIKESIDLSLLYSKILENIQNT